MLDIKYTLRMLDLTKQTLMEKSGLLSMSAASIFMVRVTEDV